MANLKIEFQKPKLTLCNTNYAPLGTLTNKTHMSAHNVTLTSRVNETPYLSFDIQLGGLIDNNSTELLVKHKNDYFVIKNISMTSGDTNRATVKAEHIACELKGIMVSHFEDLTDVSPRNMWETIRTNCSMSRAIENRYIFETNIVDTYRCLSGEGEKSVYEHLLNIAEQFESCLLFSTDDDGIIHIKLLYGDINRGKFIRKGKDLKQLNLNFSTDSLFTKIIPFGATNDDGEELTIKGVNNGKPYITNYDYYLAKGMTGEEILNNPLCNQEYIYRNTDITDARDLLRLGREELDKLSKPTLDGTIEAIDLNVLEGSSYLSPILCEKIIVVDKDINYSISCKITEIEFMYDNPLESKIGISNVVRYGSTLRNLVRNSEAIGQVLTSGSNGSTNLNTSRIKSGTLSSCDSSTWINLDNGDFNFKDKIKSINNDFFIDINNVELSDAFISQYQKDKTDINNRIEGINGEINSVNGQLDNKADDKTVRFKDKLYLDKIFNHFPIDTTNRLQGYCIVGDNIIFSLINSEETKAYLYKYNLLDDSISEPKTFTNLKHGNDMCYVADENAIYIAIDGRIGVAKINATTLDYIGNVSFPIGVGAIGFDNTLNLFVVRNYLDEKFYIINKNLEITSSFYHARKLTEQGLCINNGLIYMTYFEAGSDSYGQVEYNSVSKDCNYINVFDLKGNLVKTWNIGKFGEIEGIDFIGDYAILGINSCYELRVEFYKCQFKDNLIQPKLTTSLVEEIGQTLYAYLPYTIYIDKSSKGMGNGTVDSPFSSLKEAIRFIYNCKNNTYFNLSLKGDFTSEKNIYISGLSKKIFIDGNNLTTIDSITFDSCKFVRLSNIIINNVSNDKNAIYLDCSTLDLRNCTLTNSKNANNAIGIKGYCGNLILGSAKNNISNFALKILTLKVIEK